ncbi:MAG: hypothetical protein ABI791_00680 [Acidobacteriota bacterium]
MPNAFQNPLTNTIADFLSSIGIEVVPAQLDSGCFLPGIRVENGTLLVDEAKLTYPGDLFHEAGHLAVAPSDLRPSLTGEVIIPDTNMDAVEVQATAWAYAAIIHLGLDPRVLFHDGGYDGKSEGLLFTYGAGVYPGAFGLSRLGMTMVGAAAGEAAIAQYPHMTKWLRN